MLMLDLITTSTSAHLIELQMCLSPVMEVLPGFVCIATENFSSASIELAHLGRLFAENLFAAHHYEPKLMLS